MFKMDKQSFVEQLRIAIEWTSVLSQNFDFEKGFYGTVFRKTNPIINNILLYSFDGDYVTWNVDECNVSNYKSALSQAISCRGIVEKKMSYRGRILCFTIGLTTNDGVAVIESDCFMDESDVPPIDTWFYISENNNTSNSEIATLFCWIPSEFERVVQKAIDIEMMKSYFWFDRINPAFNDEVLSESF